MIKRTVAYMPQSPGDSVALNLQPEGPAEMQDTPPRGRQRNSMNPAFFFLYLWAMLARLLTLVRNFFVVVAMRGRSQRLPEDDVSVDGDIEAPSTERTYDRVESSSPQASVPSSPARSLEYNRTNSTPLGSPQRNQLEEAQRLVQKTPERAPSHETSPARGKGAASPPSPPLQPLYSRARLNKVAELLADGALAPLPLPRPPGVQATINSVANPNLAENEEENVESKAESTPVVPAAPAIAVALRESGWMQQLRVREPDTADAQKSYWRDAKNNGRNYPLPELRQWYEHRPETLFVGQ